MAIRNDRDVDTRRDERGWQHHVGDVQRSTSQHDREDRDRDEDDERGWFDRVRDTASRWFHHRDEDERDEDDEWLRHERGTLGRRGDVGVSGRTPYDRYDERGRFTGFAGDDERRYFGEGSRNRPFGDERNERGRFDRDVDTQRFGGGSARRAGRSWDERDRDRDWAASRDREWADRRDREWADRRERMGRAENERIARERERERMARDRDRDRVWRDERERELERERMWREHHRLGPSERERGHGQREWQARERGRDERERGDRTPWREDRTRWREDRTPYRGERTPYSGERGEMYGRGSAYRGGEMFGDRDEYRGRYESYRGRDESDREPRNEIYGAGRDWMQRADDRTGAQRGGLDRDEYGRYIPGSEEHVEHDDRMRRGTSSYDERRRR